MAINKVIYGNTTLVDLTQDTVTEDDVRAGKTLHKADGTSVTGTLQSVTRGMAITSTTTFPEKRAKLKFSPDLPAGEGIASGMMDTDIDVEIKTGSDWSDVELEAGWNYITHPSGGSAYLYPDIRPYVIPDDAEEENVLSGKTFHAGNVNQKTGTMTNNGTVTTTITAKAQSVTIPEGYHNGSGSVSIASAQQALIIPENIKKDVTILGVTGTHEGGGGGTDVSDTTATASDVRDTKYFHTADGTGTQGTLHIDTLTPSSSGSTITSGSTYEASTGGYAIDDYDAVTPTADGVAFSSGFNKMATSGYAYSERPSAELVKVVNESVLYNSTVTYSLEKDKQYVICIDTGTASGSEGLSNLAFSGNYEIVNSDDYGSATLNARVYSTVARSSGYNIILKAKSDGDLTITTRYYYNSLSYRYTTVVFIYSL